MTKAEFIIAQLHEADSHLRAAIVAAGDMKRRTGRAGMGCVIDEIRESQWHLDSAIAHTEVHSKVVAKKSQRRI